MKDFFELREATTGRVGVKCGAEKSQFGGYRALCKRGSKTIYTSQVSYKDEATAKKHAEVYADAYYSQGDRAAQRATSEFEKKNASKKFVKESVEEGYKSEIRENKNALLKRYHKYKDKQMSPVEAQEFRKLVRKLKAMGVSLKESSDVEESTKAYANSQEKIRDKKKKDAISSSDKEKLAKLKKMMSKESSVEEGYKSPAEAQAIIDGKKAARQGKKYSDNPHKKGSKEFTAWSKGHNMARESVEESKKSHPQGSAHFYRGAMDKYKAKTPKKSPWDMYMDKRKTKKEDNDLGEKKYKAPTQAEIDADKKKDSKGKSRSSMSYKSAKKSVYKNMMGELGEAKESGMDIARRIVKDKQHEKGVDMQTANFILQIYNKVNDANKKKMDGSSLKQLVGLAQRVMGK